ncbi:MAG TPA: hypothetical protein DEA05_08520 [Rhodobacteraceae bacterium]|nr:hypothetical protein [Paracoccaceae bacterium]
MKLAIVVGHNSASQGAVRQDTGESEFVWNGRLARRIERLATNYSIQVRTFFRTPGGGYSREIERVYSEVDAWAADASVELHFNASGSPDATGTETLSSGTALSLRLAESVQREMVVALGLRDRGIKTRAAEERGGGALHSGRSPAILIEPFFGSSPVDNRATDEESEQERLADAILRGAAEAWRSWPRRDLTESRTINAARTQRTAQAVQGQAGIAAGVAAAATQAREQIADLPAIGGLANWTPWLALGLIGVVLAATVVQRIMSDRIEEARVDDHERGVR